MTAVETVAPGKINWTLEVLGRRPDGYHEVRTVLQAIDLSDEVRVSPARTIDLALSGRREALGGLPAERNLAYRAALALSARVGHGDGARIEIEKRIPAGVGLGGGSSDAAAVLRALVALWGIEMSPADLAGVAAGLGSDVPFFLSGGTALAGGRGEAVTALPDLPPLRLILALPRGEAPPGKTAQMYAHLRDDHFSDGSATERLVGRLRAGASPRPEDLLNVFDAVALEADPQVGRALTVGQRSGAALHLTGSGAGLYCLAPENGGPELAAALAAAGYEVHEVSTLPSPAVAALRIEGPQTAP